MEVKFEVNFGFTQHGDDTKATTFYTKHVIIHITIFSGGYITTGTNFDLISSPDVE